MPSTHPISSKPELRAHFRAARQAIEPADRLQREASIRQHLAQAPELLAARCVAAFMAFDGEPDIGPLLTQWQAKGIRVALPLIDRQSGLSFREWPAGTALQKNWYGIDEPRAGARLAISALDVMLVPLVAWDGRGNRLGMGAGYYDRALEPCRASLQPLRVGVAFAVQRAERLPADELDVPLHAVVTEAGWFTCRD